MIKITYHPSDELLSSHVNGDLPESLAVGVSLHCALCQECKAKAERLTQQLADIAWQINETDIMPYDSQLSFDYAVMIDAITQTETDETYLRATPKHFISVVDKIIEVPYLLHRYTDMTWHHFGTVSRVRLVEEDEGHSNLLHIAAGGEIPCHTHKGFELTLLLDGSFEDESGYYTKGDFIWLDNSHQHSPKTANGCLCYTVQNAPLHFTKGISKLFNPIGGFLY